MGTQAEFDQMIKSGELIESPKEMTPDYLKELKHTLIVSAHGVHDEASCCVWDDIQDECSYGPWKRGLDTVMAEDNADVGNGRMWMMNIVASGGAAKNVLVLVGDSMHFLGINLLDLKDQ